MRMPRKVLITGGGGDIAKAITHQLESEDYEVYAPGRVELDVTNPSMIERVVGEYAPDILVNNAGYVAPQSMRNANMEQTRRHIDVNLAGTFWCTEATLSVNPRARIVNVASAAAIEPHATWSEYCAAKAGVVMATCCWAEDGIDAVAISPGRTRTKMRKSLFPDEDQSTLLEPEDFARVVAKAIRGGYKPGSHIVVRKQNVQQLLDEGE